MKEISTVQIKQDPQINISKGIVQSIASLWVDHEFEDFKVEVDGETISCHSLVLAACSGFFRGLLRSRMIECQERLVHLKDIPAETFKSVLESVYTGRDVLTSENVTDILIAADQLQISFLVEHCEKFVSDHLNLSSFETVYHNAFLMRSKYIRNKLTQFIFNNFSSVVKTETFLELEFESLYNIVEDSELVVESEDLVLYSIYRWVEHGECLQAGVNTNVNAINVDRIILATDDSEDDTNGKDGNIGEKVSKENIADDSLTEDIVIGSNEQSPSMSPVAVEDHLDSPFETNRREEHLSELLGASRLCLATSSCLLDLYHREISQRDPAVLNMLFQATTFQMQNYSLHGFWPDGSEHRECSGLEHVGVVCDGRSCEALSLREIEWFKMPGKQWKLYGFNQLVVHNRELYSCNRLHDDDECSINVLHNDTWKEQAVISGENFLLLAHEKFIYFFNTDDGGISWFDPREKLIHELNAQVRSPTHALSYYGKILIFCSVIKNNVPNTLVHCWDTANDSWSRLENFSGTAKNMASFRDSQNVYLLESSGSLWKVVQQSNIVGFVLLKKIWNHENCLRGAFLHRKTLFLFGDDPTEVTEREDVYEEVFTHVEVWGQSCKTSNFVHFVYPKKYLKTVKPKQGG